MAYTHDQLEALNNSLLASGQPEKITAIKHRQYNRAVQQEMYDPQSRGNLLALITKALSVGTNDEVLIVSNGQARLVDKGVLLSGVSSNRVYLGRMATVNIPAEGSVGEYLQNSDTGTYWQWTPDDAEDPTGPGSFEDTGDLIENVEFDTTPTMGSVNAVTSEGIKIELDTKANIIHTHNVSDVNGLAEELDEKLYIDEFLTALVANVSSGSGISLAIVEGKLRITNTGDGGTGTGDFVDIGGLPLDNLALAAEFAKYQKTPVWTTVTPSGGVVTLPAVNGTNDYYEYTESGPVTLAHSGTFEDAGHKWVRVTLGSSSHAITLGAGYTDKEGVAQTEIVLTGTAGRVKEFYLVRKGSSWIVYEDAGGNTGTGLPAGGTTGQVLKKQSDTDGDADWEDETGGGGNGETIQKTFTQTTHGFVVGDVLKKTGTSFSKAQSDSAANAEVVGIVSEVVDANNFVLTLGGFVDITGLGLTENTTYFLSASIAGGITATEPSAVGNISKPILVTLSTTEATFVNYRGIQVASSVSTSFDGAPTPTGAAPTVNIDLSGKNFPAKTLAINNTSTGNISLTFSGFVNGTTLTYRIKNNDAITRAVVLPASSDYVIYNNSGNKTLSIPTGKNLLIGITYDGSQYNITKVSE